MSYDDVRQESVRGGLLDFLRRVLGYLRGAVTGPPPPPPRTWRDEMLEAHNAKRSAASPLKIDARLNAAAQSHADHMAKVGRLGHDGIGDGTAPERVSKQHYAWRACGENVAWNQRTVAAVMADWWLSPGHARNIASADYRDAGFGRVEGANGVWWCAVYASERGAARLLKAVPAGLSDIGEPWRSDDGEDT